MAKESKRNKSPRQGAGNSGNPIHPRAKTLTDAQVDLAELTRTNRQLRRKVFDLYTVFEISRNFNAVLDYELLLETFIFTCLGQIGAQRGAIFLKRDMNSEWFYLAKAKGSGGHPDPDWSISDKTELMLYLSKLNRPVLTAELIEDVANKSESRILAMFEAGVVVPLIHQTRLEGLFLLSDKLSGNEFSPDDMEFLSSLGNQISVAIENARLYQAERVAMEQLRAAQHQLVQSERLAALGEMSAKIAHEVNNPLGIIKNYLLMLQRAAKGEEKICEYTEIVSQEIDRIAAIVGQLREFQRPMKMEMSAVNVQDVVEDTLDLLERQLHSDGIVIERQFEADRTTVHGNADSLKQVFLNLLINARAAIEAGGHIRISLRCTDDDKLELCFCDSGPGIDPEIIPKIFEPFYTTKGEEGTGLGLSVCYGIIKSHGGSIRYRNPETDGCFEILLPLREEQHLDDGQTSQNSRN